MAACILERNVIMATPHNSAEYGQYADTVLMPGDPLRAQWIAENFLEEACLVSRVRNIFGFTGTYKGRRISIMASGMGMPSIGIYSYELYQYYDVRNIIRVGSVGAYSPQLELMDVILADAAWSESSFARTQNGDVSEWQYPSKELNDVILRTASDIGKTVCCGHIHSSDVFYRDEEGQARASRYTERGLIGVEMECFALFHNARYLGRRAACLLTVSDSFVTDTHLDAAARETAFGDMIELALESAIRL